MSKNPMGRFTKNLSREVDRVIELATRQILDQGVRREDIELRRDVRKPLETEACASGRPVFLVRVEIGKKSARVVADVVVTQ